VLGGHAYRSSWISDSFGVAHVADFPGVRVYTDNQLAGVTNASGNVVLPRLRAYENNKIRIDSRDLPLNAQVDALSVEATPYFRTGVLAEFPIRKASGALFQIMLDNGQTLPAGSTVEVNAGETRFPVANDGEVYVTGLVKQNKFVARWKNQSCAFDISLEPSNDPLPDLGRVVCHGVLP
jgi:outer membrane usher protein